jgi:hypothetical protein
MLVLPTRELAGDFAYNRIVIPVLDFDASWKECKFSRTTHIRSNFCTIYLIVTRGVFQKHQYLPPLQ